MIFSWFSTGMVDAFVDGEVANLIKRTPPAMLAADGSASAKMTDQLARGHDLLLRRARDFVRREKPNLYQKARIASRLKWNLHEAGYPQGFVDEFTYALAKVVASSDSPLKI